MKKRIRFPRFLCSAVLALGILSSLLLSGCTQSSASGNSEAVLPPIRMSEYPAEACLGNVPGTVQEAIERSDAVATVRVGDWLGDSVTKMSTLFSAEVIETVKGELPNRFTLMQEGSSELIYRDYPLFTHGNELFLFLTKIPEKDAEFLKYPKDTYKITGSYTGVMHLVELDGEKYVIPHNCAIFQEMPDSVKNLAQDEAFLKSAVDELIRSDSIWERFPSVHQHLYKLDELIRALRNA